MAGEELLREFRRRLSEDEGRLADARADGRRGLAAVILGRSRKLLARYGAPSRG